MLSTTNIPIRLRVVQILMVGPLGVMVAGASIYFGVIAPEQSINVADWLVGAWALTLGASSTYVGANLVAKQPRLRPFAFALLVCHLMFGLVKLIGYHESASVTFIALDVLTLALLAKQPNNDKETAS